LYTKGIDSKQLVDRVQHLLIQALKRNIVDNIRYGYPGVPQSAIGFGVENNLGNREEYTRVIE
jgi:hypothetical protein